MRRRCSSTITARVFLCYLFNTFCVWCSHCELGVPWHDRVSHNVAVRNIWRLFPVFASFSPRPFGVSYSNSARVSRCQCVIDFGQFDTTWILDQFSCSIVEPDSFSLRDGSDRAMPSQYVSACSRGGMCNLPDRRRQEVVQVSRSQMLFCGQEALRLSRVTRSE